MTKELIDLFFKLNKQFPLVEYQILLRLLVCCIVFALGIFISGVVYGFFLYFVVYFSPLALDIKSHRFTTECFCLFRRSSWQILYGCRDGYPPCNIFFITVIYKVLYLTIVPSGRYLLKYRRLFAASVREDGLDRKESFKLMSSCLLIRIQFRNSQGFYF